MAASILVAAFVVTTNAAASFGIGRGIGGSHQTAGPPTVELPPVAPNDTPDPSGRELTPKESLERDAAHYASDYGVTLDEAVKRLQWQAESQETIAELREAAGSGLGGVWKEHRPNWRVIVSYAGDDAGYSRLQGIAAAAMIPVEVRRAQFTESEVLAILDAAVAELSEMNGYAGSYLTVRSDEIVIEVEADSEHADNPADLERELEARYGFQFTVNVIDGPAVPLAAVYAAPATGVARVRIPHRGVRF